MWVCVCLCVGGGDKSVERDGRREGVEINRVSMGPCVGGAEADRNRKKAGQTTVNKRAPIRYIIPKNYIVHRPL